MIAWKLFGELCEVQLCSQRLTYCIAVLCVCGLETAGLSIHKREELYREPQQYDVQLWRRAGGSPAPGNNAPSPSSTSTGAFLRGILAEISHEHPHKQAAGSKASSASTSAFLRDVFAEHSPPQPGEQEVTSKGPASNAHGSPSRTAAPARDASPSNHEHTADAARASEHGRHHEASASAQAPAPSTRRKPGRRRLYDPEERKERIFESKYRSLMRSRGVPAPYAHPKRPKSTGSQAAEHSMAAPEDSRMVQPLSIPIDRRRPGPKPGTSARPSAYTEEERRQRKHESQQRYQRRLAGVEVPPVPGYRLRSTKRKEVKQRGQTTAGNNLGQASAVPLDVALLHPSPGSENGAGSIERPPDSAEEKKRRRAAAQRRYRLKVKSTSRGEKLQ